MKWVSLLLLVAFSLPALFALPEKDPTKTKEIGPMEIDCSPLDKATSTKYTVKVVVASKDGSYTEIPVKVGGHPSSVQIAETIDDALPVGWDRSRAGSKVTIRGYKGSPVKSITVTLDGEVQTLAPTVKRLSPKNKK